jgi:hypothetical protein
VPNQEFSHVPFEMLDQSDLIVDMVYESKRGHGVHLGIEPLTKLIPGASLMGGIRRRIDPASKRLVALVLMSTKKESDWPDYLDVYSGTYVYYGDNRDPGKSLLDTSRKGNKALEDIFRLANGTADERAKCPIILAFENTGHAHDCRFVGLLVPGTNLNSHEDLVAVWATKNGKRFQNYRAKFTVLDAGKISGSWIRDIFALKPLSLEDPRVPGALVDWILTGRKNALIADPKRTIRSISDQMPQSELEKSIIEEILLLTKHDPTEFEFVANEIWKIHCGQRIQSGVTRKVADGGRDAHGFLSIGPDIDPIQLSFALEAKAYSPGNNVGVKELARLISRLKHREFGVLVTTSAVSKQAYLEVRGDGHPLVILAGQDIAHTLIQAGINTPVKVSNWISSISKVRMH